MAQALDSTLSTTAAIAATTTSTTTTPPTTCSECHSGTTAQTHHATPYFTNGQCSYCHVGVTSTGDCSTCHTFGLQNTHHASAPALAGNCAQCHTNVGDYKVCLSCHGGKIRTRHHDIAKAQAIGCKSCHATLVSDGSCRSCHITPPRQRHHDVAASQSISCKTCHSGIVETASGCSSCHNFKVANPHHTNAVDPYRLTCGSCHQSVWDQQYGIFRTTAPSTAECVQCHTTVVGTASIADTHHMTLPATTGQCTTCHQGVTPVTDCTVCHSTANGAMVTRHHSLPAYALGNCATCHVGAQGTGIACATCHSKPPHHQTAQAVAGDCKFCHSTIQTQGSGCASCHTAPIRDIHHGAPLQSVGGNCGACHQTVNDPSVCANCHTTSSPHHTTTWSQQGDCTHCHKVPAYAAEHPKQAACRECHGTNKHDKGGPIKDFGACRACHTHSPLHAAPGRAVGYTRTAPGKGKFAFFWQQYSGGREEVRPDINPNGDDLGDEGGYKWSKPTLSYNKVQISHNGQTYTVPSFDLASSVSLTDCTRCHADQKAKVSCTDMLWTSHLTKQYVSLALYQMAESTYLGSLCGSAGGNLCTVAGTGTYLEAEHYNSIGTNFTALAGTGMNNGQYLKATVSATSTQSGTPVSYTLKFGETGTYYLWFRGNDAKSSSSNSLWYGLDGVRVGDVKTPATDSNWRWVNARDANGPTVATITVSTTGTHTLNVWAKEANFQLDGIYITKASGILPGGNAVTIPTGSAVISPTSCGGIVAPPPPPPAPVNLALNKAVTTTRQESGYEGAKAVDGSTTTRWWARSTSTHSIRVDLGSPQTISKVSVSWYSYYASSYQVQVSTDGTNWTSVASVSSATGGNRDHTFTARSARYVRIYCTRASSSNGYSLNELNVFQ